MCNVWDTRTVKWVLLSFPLNFLIYITKLSKCPGVSERSSFERGLFAPLLRLIDLSNGEDVLFIELVYF